MVNMKKNTVLLRFPLYILFIILLNLSKSTSNYPFPVTSETNSGILEGLRLYEKIENLTTITSTYDRYYGIPFAEPPVGDLRFEDPRPVKKWSGLLDAREKKPSCVQLTSNPFYENQSEDCLYLNIFSPYEASAPLKSYPVIFYIHGGSYRGGSGHVYNGKVISMMGIVVVTINYRLEILGFLTAGDSILPGNYGLRDVVMALKWVHDNIASFRGDASRLTLVGHSVGSALVGILMTMPSTQGLFWTAVAHSGSAAAYYSCFTKQSTNFTEFIRSFGLAVGCEDSNYNVSHIKNCLKNISTDNLLEFNQQFNSAFGVEYRPIVDNKLMLEHPREAFMAGRFHKVPFFTGVVQNEFSYIIDHYSKNGADAVSSEMWRLQNEMMTCKSGNMSTIVESIQLNYIDWNKSLELKKNNVTKEDFIKYNYHDLANDILMIAPSLFISDVLSTTNPNVFYYYFEHERSLHTFDINYIFGVPFGNEPVENSVWNKNWNESTIEDQKLSEKMMKLWVSIFQNSRPDSIDGLTWPRYNKTTQHYITISTQPATISQYFQIKTNYFWNSYLPTFFQKICGNSVHEWSDTFSTTNRSAVFQSEIFIILLTIMVEMIVTYSSADVYRFW